jgi:hypothetical protein
MGNSTLQHYFTLLIVLFTIFLAFSPRIQAQVDETSLKAMGDALEWPMSMYFDESSELDGGLVDLDDGEETSRRSLLWTRTHYYISYGALSANRIPCPARSGRSYYSHNCFKSRIPVNPYSRGCSRITRCRRWVAGFAGFVPELSNATSRLWWYMHVLVYYYLLRRECLMGSDHFAALCLRMH